MMSLFPSFLFLLLFPAITMLQTFRALVTDLLSPLNDATHTGPSGGHHPPTSIAPLYAAVSHWPEACSSSWINSSAAATADKNQPRSGSGSGCPAPAASSPAPDPFGLALHCALSHLFTRVICKSAAATADTPLTSIVPTGLRRRESSMSLSGSSGTEREWLVCTALARAGMSLIDPTCDLENLEGRVGDEMGQEASSSLILKLAKLYDESCLQLLSIIRWSLAHVIPSASDDLPPRGDLLGGARSTPLSPTLPSSADPRQERASVASAHHLACEMLCALSGWTGISHVYTEVGVGLCGPPRRLFLI